MNKVHFVSWEPGEGRQGMSRTRWSNLYSSYRWKFSQTGSSAMTLVWIAQWSEADAELLARLVSWEPGKGGER